MPKAEASRDAKMPVTEYYRRRVAVVTGAASGVGLALADAMLAFEAQRVVLVDIDADGLRDARERLSNQHPGAVAEIRCDVTDEAAVKAMIKRAAQLGDGRIDLLFNNAGAAFSGPFSEQSDEAWERAFALNFYAALYAIQEVLPLMRAQAWGHIVNIISGIALTPMAYQTRYAASKAALNGLSLALRYELWDEGIRVTSATPGTTATSIWDRNAPAHAQAPAQAARAILNGVAENQRLVLGDACDLQGARTCFAPESAEALDAYLIDVARRRRTGESAV